MDLGTMMDKVERQEYRSFAQLLADFLLICHNCMSFNEP
jgi:hypothetical protein